MKCKLARPNKFKINYEKIVLCLAATYFLYNIYLFSENAAAEKILDAMQGVFLLGLGVLFLYQRGSKKNISLRIITMLIFAMSFLYSGTFPYLKYGMVILAGINCNERSLHRKLLKVYTVFVALTVMLGMTGVLPSRIVRRDFSTYGFVHSNMLALCILAILCSYVMAYYEEFRRKNYIMALALVLVTWALTGSRTTMASMCILIVMVYISKKYPKIFRLKGMLYYTGPWLPVILTVLSCLMGIYYDEAQAFFYDLNDWLNGRPLMANTFMNIIEPEIWGQRIEITLVENAYLVGLYQFGVIPSVVMLGIYGYAIKRCICEKAYGRLCCLLTFAVHGLTETSTFSPFSNVALLSVFSKNEVFNDRQYK